MKTRKIRCTVSDLAKILEENPKHTVFLDSAILQEYVEIGRDALARCIVRNEELGLEVGVILSEDEIVVTYKSLKKPN